MASAKQNVAFFDEATGRWLIKQAGLIRPSNANDRGGADGLEPVLGFWGMIVSEGPNGEEDYTDERYWVQRMYVDGDVGTPGEDLNLSAFTLDNTDDTPFIVTASNIAELVVTNVGAYSSGTHDTDADTLVFVEQGLDAGRNHFYWFNRGGGGESRRVVVSLTNPTGTAGNSTTRCAFRYDVNEIGTGTLIASNVAMTGYGQRQFLLTYSPGTIGHGYFNGSTFVLIWADEIGSQLICPVEPP